jgi:hypothetical protein
MFKVTDRVSQNFERVIGEASRTGRNVGNHQGASSS